MKKHIMNKADRQISGQAAMELLCRGRQGTLCLNGDEGYPYGVPVNYVVADGKIYIHSSLRGYKTDCIKADDKCCLSVIVSCDICPMKMTAYYESVIVTGKAVLIEDEAEKRRALEGIVTVLGAGHEAVGFDMIERLLDRTAIIRIDAEEISGKVHCRQ